MQMPKKVKKIWDVVTTVLVVLVAGLVLLWQQEVFSLGIWQKYWERTFIPTI